MSARQLRSLIYLFGGFLLGQVGVWAGFAAYLWASGQL
jgi:hypothetical protein